MIQQFRAKAFKSGNSVALRLPKAIGLVEGDEVQIVPHQDGGYTFWRVADDRAMFLALAGRLSDSFMADGRGDTEQPARDWKQGRSVAAA